MSKRDGNPFSSDIVTDPDGTSRPAEDRDSLMHINEDGTVTIPRDAEVFADPRGALWFRAPRLQGWAGIHGGSPIVVPGPVRTVREEVVAELRRQGRDITPGLPPGYRE